MKPTLLFLALLACSGPLAEADEAMNRREWIEFLARDLITRIDADGDGKVSEPEVRAAAPLDPARGLDRPRVALPFDAVDADGDGKLSRQELQRALRKQPRVGVVFDDYDLDNDLHLRSWEMKEPPTNVGIQFRF